MDFYKLDDNSPTKVNALIARVTAGLPINVASDIERVDMNKLFAGSDDSCLLVRIRGTSMLDVIDDGDWILLSRQMLPRPGEIVVARLGDGYTIKRFEQDRNGLRLAPSNSDYKTHEITESDEFELLGTVVWVFKPLSPRT